MTAADVVILVAVAVLWSGAAGVWFGRRLAREETRIRGEHALAVLEGMTLTQWADPTANVTPYVATARLLARATYLPDPFPATTPKGTP